MVWKVEYLPFGEVFSEDKDPDGDGVEVDQPFRFPGQYEDAETGLYYNYFRDYDPRIGRYVEADPILQVFLSKLIKIGNDKGKKQHLIPSLICKTGTLKSYNYANMNPVKDFDSKGLSSCIEKLQKCNLHAMENEMECLRTVTKGYIACAAACTIACLPTGPGYPECIITREAACAAAGLVAMEFCHVLLTVEAGICFNNYIKCKRECG